MIINHNYCIKLVPLVIFICYNFVTFVQGVRILCYDEFVVNSGDETLCSQRWGLRWWSCRLWTMCCCYA